MNDAETPTVAVAGAEAVAVTEQLPGAVTVIVPVCTLLMPLAVAVSVHWNVPAAANTCVGFCAVACALPSPKFQS